MIVHTATGAATAIRTISGAMDLAVDVRGQVHTPTGIGVEVIAPDAERWASPCRRAGAIRRAWRCTR